MAAALSGVRFLRCVGIEVLPALHDCAQVSHWPAWTSLHGSTSRHLNPLNPFHDCAQAVVEDVQRGLSNPHAATTTNASYAAHHRVAVAAQSLPAGLPLMDARLGDFLVEDWSDADFAFTASLGFSELTQARLMEVAAQRLRPGARLVTLTLPQAYHTALARLDAGPAGPAGLGGLGGHSGGEADTDGGGACFALERAAWCKLTWGRVRAYVFVRTSAPALAPVSDPVVPNFTHDA